MGLSVDDDAPVVRVLAAGCGLSLCSSLGPFFGGSRMEPDEVIVEAGDPADDP